MDASRTIGSRQIKGLREISFLSVDDFDICFISCSRRIALREELSSEKLLIGNGRSIACFWMKNHEDVRVD